jgi:hypothetical protein
MGKPDLHLASWVLPSWVSAKGGPDDEPPGLWDQTAGFPDEWSQCRNPELRETDLGDGRILVPCFD